MVLHRAMGTTGLLGFGVGLFGAGLSSALTIPLGTQLALADLLGLDAGNRAASAPTGAHAPTPTPAPSPPASPPAPAAQSSDGVARAGSLAASDAMQLGYDADDADAGRRVRYSFKQRAAAGRWERVSRASWRELLAWRRAGHVLFMTAFLLLALIPSLLRLPPIAVILTAQVVNGCLLPCVASALLLSVNSYALMGGYPQTIRLNFLIFPCVALAAYLAAVVILNKVLAAAGAAHAFRSALACAAPLAAAWSLALLVLARRVSRPGGRAGAYSPRGASRLAEPEPEAHKVEVGRHSLRPPC